MKKYLALVLGVIFTLGFAVSAFAITAEIPADTQAVVAKDTSQITLGGELRFRGWYTDNTSGTRRAVSNPADGPSQGWHDNCVRLRLQADVSKNTMGVIHLETTSGWAETTSRSYTSGTLNAKPSSEFGILEAWLLHKGTGLLGIPAGIKVGHMPIALGERQFLDHTRFGDDAIVLFADPTKELHIGLLTAKFREGSSDTASTADATAYAALATYKVNKDNTVGVNYTLINDTGLTTTATLATLATTGQKFNFQNLGLHANGKLADVKYTVAYDTQFGNQSDTVKFKGYGIFANLGYDIKPVTVRAGYARGSGDAGNTDAAKNKDFQTTLGIVDDVHYTFIYEYTTRDASSNRGLGQGTRSNGISNTTYYRLGLDTDITKDLKASVDYFILKATEAATGSKDIGNEYNAKLIYKIDKNLTYSITAGILDPGKWWVDTAGVTTANNKNITQMVHALTLSF